MSRRTFKIKDWGSILTEDGARREFGVTDNPGDAGYILENGDLLDFSQGGGMGRVADHRSVVYDGDPRKYGVHSHLMFEFCRRWHAIRFLPEVPGIDVFAPVSINQQTTLRDIAEMNPIKIVEARAYFKKSDRYETVKTFEGEYDGDSLRTIIQIVNNKIEFDGDKPEKKTKRVLLDSGYTEDEAQEIADDLERQHPAESFEVEEARDGTYSVFEIR